MSMHRMTSKDWSPSRMASIWRRLQPSYTSYSSYQGRAFTARFPPRTQNWTVYAVLSCRLMSDIVCSLHCSNCTFKLTNVDCSSLICVISDIVRWSLSRNVIAPPWSYALLITVIIMSCLRKVSLVWSDITTEWQECRSSALVVNKTLMCEPTVQPSVFRHPCQMWCLLTGCCASHGQCTGQYTS